MKIKELPTGQKVVKRYLGGRCYAAVWSFDSTEKQIRRDIAQGDARFFPYNESKNMYVGGGRSGRRFRK